MKDINKVIKFLAIRCGILDQLQLRGVVFEDRIELKAAFYNKNLEGMGLENFKVNCYSGHTYAEEPRSFLWEGIKYEVEEIERAWHKPGKRHFQVRTRNNKLFQLCYNEREKRWSVIELLGS